MKNFLHSQECLDIVVSGFIESDWEALKVIENAQRQVVVGNKKKYLMTLWII